MNFCLSPWPPEHDRAFREAYLRHLEVVRAETFLKALRKSQESQLKELGAAQAAQAVREREQTLERARELSDRWQKAQERAHQLEVVDKIDRRLRAHRKKVREKYTAAEEDGRFTMRFIETIRDDEFYREQVRPYEAGA